MNGICWLLQRFWIFVPRTVFQLNLFWNCFHQNKIFVVHATICMKNIEREGIITEIEDEIINKIGHDMSEFAKKRNKIFNSRGDRVETIV